MAEGSTPFIGRSLKPHKTSRFLTGRGTYVSDIRLPNMLHAALLRSTRAHARIHNIDVREALQMKGGAGVWTGRDIDHRIALFPESFEIHPRPWLEGVKPTFQGPPPAALALGQLPYVFQPLPLAL